MHTDVREKFPAYLNEHEGLIDYMYTDNKGFVTVGLGMKIDTDAELAGFCNNGYWKPKRGADLDMVRHPLKDLLRKDHDAVWKLGREGLARVDAETLHKKAVESTYKKKCAAVTMLRLTSTGLSEVYKRALNYRDDKLRRSIWFRHWDSYPADAQMVLLDLAWWLPEALTALRPMYKAVDFTPLCQACQQLDFGLAAQVVTRWDALPDRKKARRLLFRNAAVVRQRTLGISRVFYPADLDFMAKSKAPIIGLPPDQGDHNAPSRTTRSG